MARPEGAQALRAIQKDLDEGRSLPGINYIPLPGIGEGLGEWFELPQNLDNSNNFPIFARKIRINE